MMMQFQVRLFSAVVVFGHASLHDDVAGPPQPCPAEQSKDHIVLVQRQAHNIIESEKVDVKTSADEPYIKCIPSRDTEAQSRCVCGPQNAVCSDTDNKFCFAPGSDADASCQNVATELAMPVSVEVGSDKASPWTQNADGTYSKREDVEESDPISRPTQYPTPPPANVVKDGSGGMCPPQQGGPVLFSHIPKTGGTVMHFMLDAAIKRSTSGKHNYRIIDPYEERNLEDTDYTQDSDASSFFVIGLVRRPCDHLLSWYFQGLNEKATWATSVKGETRSKEAFKNFVMDRTNGVTKYPPLMSQDIAERYGTIDKFHCMLRTHNLKGDFSDCMHKYESCGGTLFGADLSQLVDDALVKGAESVHKDGRSVGDHPSCTDMFDDEMMANVLQTEQAVIDNYSLGACCSSDSKA